MSERLLREDRVTWAEFFDTKLLTWADYLKRWHLFDSWNGGVITVRWKQIDFRVGSNSLCTLGRKVARTTKNIEVLRRISVKEVILQIPQILKTLQTFRFICTLILTNDRVVNCLSYSSATQKRNNTKKILPVALSVILEQVR